MTGDLVLAIDLGTGGPKVALVDDTSKVVDISSRAVATFFAEDGRATQDADEWWRLITEMSRRLVRDPSIARRVRAVGVTGQYGSTVPVDANGHPTGPCMTWMDSRGATCSRRVIGGSFQGYRARAAIAFIRHSGGAPATSGTDPVGQILYLEHECPDVVAASRWYLEPVDYLTMRLTGVASATHASRLALWMTDNRDLTHLRYDPVLLKLVGLSDERLAPLVTFGSVVGTLTATAAEDLGLAAATVVATGIPDLHAAAIGAGATGLYDTHLALSTTSWISCPVPMKKTDVVHSIASVPGLGDGRYLVINNQETGARALDWLRGQFAGAGSSIGFEQLTALAATSPPGANGVRFSPWLAGERSPADDRRARASLTNLGVTTTTGDVVRAVLEGVAANSAWLFGHVERFVGRRLEPVRLIGGGAQSELWCQIVADALDRTVTQVAQPLVAQLRGVAHVAASAAGGAQLDAPPPSADAATFGPTAANRATYQSIVGDLPRRFARERRWRRAHR